MATTEEIAGQLLYALEAVHKETSAQRKDLCAMNERQTALSAENAELRGLLKDVISVVAGKAPQQSSATPIAAQQISAKPTATPISAKPTTTLSWKDRIANMEWGIGTIKRKDGETMQRFLCRNVLKSDSTPETGISHYAKLDTATNSNVWSNGVPFCEPIGKIGAVLVEPTSWAKWQSA